MPLISFSYFFPPYICFFTLLMVCGSNRCGMFLCSVGNIAAFSVKQKTASVKTETVRNLLPRYHSHWRIAHSVMHHHACRLDNGFGSRLLPSEVHSELSFPAAISAPAALCDFLITLLALHQRFSILKYIHKILQTKALVKWNLLLFGVIFDICSEQKQHSLQME